MSSAEVVYKDLRADFGKTAEDYGRHRAGFPNEFFERLAAMGIVRSGIRALDLGTGTGTIARGLALRGCDVTALDRSEPLMEQAREMDREAQVAVNYVVAPAEETGLDAATFDLITAGQCWHWFDRPRAAAEARRLLNAGGRLVIGHFDWIPIPGNVSDVTEKLIEKHNPKWKMGGGVGMYPQWMAGLYEAGFRRLQTFSFDIDASYSHEAWRGRIRASAGVGASLTPAAVAKFDDELRAVLAERFAGDPMPVLHRVFAAIGIAP